MPWRASAFLTKTGVVGEMPLSVSIFIFFAGEMIIFIISSDIKKRTLQSSPLPWSVYIYLYGVFVFVASVFEYFVNDRSIRFLGKAYIRAEVYGAALFDVKELRLRLRGANGLYGLEYSAYFRIFVFREYLVRRRGVERVFILIEKELAKGIFEIAFYISHGHTVGIAVSEKIDDLVSLVDVQSLGLLGVGLDKGELYGLGGRRHGHIGDFGIIPVVHIYKVGLYLGLGHKGALAFYPVEIALVYKLAYGLPYGRAAYAVYIAECLFRRYGISGLYVLVVYLVKNDLFYLII